MCEWPMSAAKGASGPLGTARASFSSGAASRNARIKLASSVSAGEYSSVSCTRHNVLITPARR
ncbi:MAG: hypothetical protein BWY37_02215 [Firmicutes bacterium ADurb.Bin262]|nr:MAG: hypothetical protein BWY37_02215 [Firmicutes bacterium ADurb.Bin262]